MGAYAQDKALAGQMFSVEAVRTWGQMAGGLRCDHILKIQMASQKALKI